MRSARTPCLRDGGRGASACLRVASAQVDRWEAAILVAVSALTVAFNLVVGVAVGVVMAAVRYAYSASLVTDVRVVPTKPGEPKRYILIGELFFGSSMRFHDFFDVANDPEQVREQRAHRRAAPQHEPPTPHWPLGSRCDVSHTPCHRACHSQVVLQMEKKVTEYSATDALQRVEMLYAEVSKTFTVEYVSRTGEVTSSTNTRTAAAAAAANASGATAAVAIEMELAGGA
jgi:MFS superfamily sulfate permease-like transporter